MDFSVGFFDELFGKRITLEIPGPDGKAVQRQVTQKWFDKMVAENRISSIQPDRVIAHIMDPVQGYSKETWVIGDDVKLETFKQFGNRSENAIYVLRCYRDGKLESNILRKELWNQAKKQMESV